MVSTLTQASWSGGRSWTTEKGIKIKEEEGARTVIKFRNRLTRKKGRNCTCN